METSLLATFMYLLVGPLVALRAADARVVAALPMIGNTVVTSFAVFNLLRFLDQVGYVSTGGNAVAAGLAEAIFPWCVGAGVSAVTSLVIAMAGPLADAGARRTRGGSIALVLASIPAATTAAFIWYLRPGAANYRPDLETVTTVPFALAVLGVIVALVSITWPKTGSSETASPGRWFWTFAAVSAAAALRTTGASDRLSRREDGVARGECGSV